MLRIMILLLVASAIGGCMVGPDYFRPKVEIPQSFRYEGKNAQNAVNMAWWKLFRDPVLDGLIAESLANNKDVKIAAANIEQAAGVLTQTRAPLFPQIAYGGSAGRLRASEANTAPAPKIVETTADDVNGIAKKKITSLPKAANPVDAFNVFAGASWEIDLWGRVRRLSESARANILASEEARRGVILSLVASVAGQYLQLRGLDEQLVIAKHNRNAYAESVRLYELQFEYGQVSMLIVEQARTQYETAAATIPQIESQIVQIENSLSILLGRNPGPITRGKTTH